MRNTEACGVKGHLIFSLYVTLCYWALVLGDATVHSLCYERLEEMRQHKEAEEVILTRQSVASPEITLLGVGQSEFSPAQPSRAWLTLPGIAVFVCTVAFRNLVKHGGYRGFAILASFTMITIVTNAASRHVAGLRFYPTQSVLIIAFFYAALFWFMDNFVRPKPFDALLEAVLAREEGRLEKLRLMYDYTKNVSVLVVGLFLAVCISMAMNVFAGVKDSYDLAGIGGIMSRWITWVVFWGALGLLGGVGVELGRRMERIVGSVETVGQSQDPKTLTH